MSFLVNGLLTLPAYPVGCIRIRCGVCLPQSLHDRVPACLPSP